MEQIELPKWFTNPNDVQTAEDLEELLEFEKWNLSQAKLNFSNSKSTIEKAMAHLDVVNSEAAVARLEDTLETIKGIS